MKKELYAKIYINSEDKEFRTGIGTYGYAKVIKMEYSHTDARKNDYFKFTVIPVKEEPKEIHYYLENKDCIVKGRHFKKERIANFEKMKVNFFINEESSKRTGKEVEMYDLKDNLLDTYE